MPWIFALNPFLSIVSRHLIFAFVQLELSQAKEASSCPQLSQIISHCLIQMTLAFLHKGWPSQEPESFTQTHNGNFSSPGPYEFYYTGKTCLQETFYKVNQCHVRLAIVVSQVNEPVGSILSAEYSLCCPGLETWHPLTAQLQGHVWAKAHPLPTRPLILFSHPLYPHSVLIDLSTPFYYICCVRGCAWAIPGDGIRCW